MPSRRMSSRTKVPAELRAIYQLVRKYPGVTNRGMVEMTTNDDRIPDDLSTEEGVNRLLKSLRRHANKGDTPAVVSRSIMVHDKVRSSGLGDAFRYLVRSVERGEYFGLREIQRELGSNSNSFQKKFNNRIIRLSKELQEVEQVYDAWLLLRYESNPIVQMHAEEW